MSESDDGVMYEGNFADGSVVVDTWVSFFSLKKFGKNSESCISM
jgi:hypothetical protein